MARVAAWQGLGMLWHGSAAARPRDAAAWRPGGPLGGTAQRSAISTALGLHRRGRATTTPAGLLVPQGSRLHREAPLSASVCHPRLLVPGGGGGPEGTLSCLCRAEGSVSWQSCRLGKRGPGLCSGRQEDRWCEGPVLCAAPRTLLSAKLKPSGPILLKLRF